MTFHPSNANHTIAGPSAFQHQGMVNYSYSGQPAQSTVQFQPHLDSRGQHHKDRHAQRGYHGTQLVVARVISHANRQLMRICLSAMGLFLTAPPSRKVIDIHSCYCGERRKRQLLVKLGGDVLQHTIKGNERPARSRSSGMMPQNIEREDSRVLRRRPIRVLIALCGVVVVTFLGYNVIPVNATTVGFAYLLVILAVASTWGFLEAALASVLATLVFNFFFLPPIGTFTIADPQNWVALSSFLATSLIASRLSAKARARASEAVERQRDLERLYAFSRAILQIETGAPFATQLLERLVQFFDLQAAVLYERGSGDFSCVGVPSPEGIQNTLRSAAVHGGTSPQEEPPFVIIAVSRGSEPVASMALRGATMPAAVLQGIANLVAIGLERPRAQDLAQQIEAARQSEQLRTTLIDAMAHEFKTPLTLIRAATTSLLANPEIPTANRTEQLAIADEEAKHLQELIDDAVEMARLDTTHIEIHPELASLDDTLREVLASMQTEIDERPVQITVNGALPPMPFDKRLLKLAIRQLLDNALKYTPAETPVQLGAYMKDSVLTVDVTDRGKGIPDNEQKRIFERFYRSPSVKGQIPGSGLGLSIADGIVRAHNGELTVSSHPGQTTFRITLPVPHREVA